MQTIRIFLSADKSLKEERQELSDLVENLNQSLESRDANILMLVWDGDADKAEFDKQMSNTDLCLTLYYETFTDSTQSELESAYQSLCEGKNPKKIYVYFKNTENVPEKLQEFRDSFPTKYGHFYCSFSNIDTLKADFLLQFMEYQSKSLGTSKLLEVSNGKVIVDGKEYVNLKNVPFAGNNEEYNLLLRSIKKTQKLLAITDEDDEEYAEYAAELQDLKDKLAKMESSLWDTALMITRLSTTKCSERLKRAMDLFTAGDNKGAQAVLNEEEIEKDVEHNLRLIQLGEEGKKGLRINIEEYLLRIKTLENEMKDGWLQEQSKLHDRIIALTTTLYGEKSLETAQAMMDAIGTLQLIGSHSELYDVTKKALEIRLNLLGEMNLDTAQSYNDLGVAAGLLGNYDEFLELTTKGLEIRKELNVSENLMAESYNTVGAALAFKGDKIRYLEFELKALDLRKKVYGKLSLKTANSFSEVGSAYGALGDDKKNLEYSVRALEIAQDVVGEKHPDTGLYHNNVADACLRLGCYIKGIMHLKKALEIQIATAGKYAFGTLRMQDNLAFAYEQNNEFEKSLDCIIEAITISERINGIIHIETSELIRRAGDTLCSLGDKDQALNYYYHALDIQFKIAEEQQLPNGPLPTFALADLCYKISSIHFSKREYERAERMLANAINIILDVEKNAPELSNWLYYLGLTYARQNKHKEALESFRSALDRRIKAYGNDHLEVAESYIMVGHANAALGNKDDAIETFQKALNILQLHLDKGNSKIINIKQLITELTK